MSLSLSTFSGEISVGAHFYDIEGDLPTTLSWVRHASMTYCYLYITLKEHKKFHLRYVVL